MDLLFWICSLHRYTREDKVSKASLNSITLKYNKMMETSQRQSCDHTLFSCHIRRAQHETKHLMLTTNGFISKYTLRTASYSYCPDCSGYDITRSVSQFSKIKYIFTLKLDWIHNFWRLLWFIWKLLQLSLLWKKYVQLECLRCWDTKYSFLRSKKHFI